MNQLRSSSNVPLAAAYSHRPIGLARYCSAPGSLLLNIADSVIGGGIGGGNCPHAETGETVAGTFFSGGSPCLTSESSCRAAPGTSPDLTGPMSRVGSFDESFTPVEYGGCGEISGGSHLIRHSSSPAGFLANLLVDSGHSSKENENLFHVDSEGNRLRMQKLRSQWTFTQQDSLSQISEFSIADLGKNVSRGQSPTKVSENFGCIPDIQSNLPLSYWDDPSSSITAPNKRSKDNHEGVFTNFSNLQTQISLPCTSMEMEAVDKYLNMHQDHVQCKLRAKRGFATHPRSIAERERRTRISKRLRRLEELVPNMDKQTNTSDMLDLALHYIKDLQTQVKKLNQERAECTCTLKQEGI